MLNPDRDLVKPAKSDCCDELEAEALCGVRFQAGSVTAKSEEHLANVEPEDATRAHIICDRAEVHAVGVGDEQASRLVNVKFLATGVANVDQPLLLELAAGVHDQTDNAGDGHAGQNYSTSEADVAEGLTVRAELSICVLC